MLIKQTIAAALSLAIMLSCVPKAAAMQYDCEPLMADSTAAEQLITANYAAATTADTKLDAAFLTKAFATAENGAVYLTVGKDGVYSLGSSSEYVQRSNLIYVKALLTEECYEYFKNDYPTYEEYITAILTLSECAQYFTESGELIKPAESKLYLAFSGSSAYKSDGFTDEELFSKAALWTDEKLHTAEVASSVKSILDSGSDYFASVSYRYTGEGIMSVYASLCSGYGEEDENFSFSENIAAGNGDELFINGERIPADTTKLFITSRDKDTALLLAGQDIPEDCFVLSSDSKYGNVTYDLAEIAEKLPKLKELHMYQALCENTASIAKMKNLTALSYYVSSSSDIFTATVTDTPFKKLPKLKTLRLYGDYKSYSFLNSMKKLTSVHVETSSNAGLESLFKCPVVTSLRINDWSVKKNLNITNIAKLKNLTALDITANNVDFAPISKLSKLKTLYVRAYGGSSNVSQLDKLDKLSSLTLMEVNTNDWSFLKGMNSLRELALSYVDTISDKDIAALKKLTVLYLTETSNSYKVLNSLPKLKSVTVSKLSGTISDFKGSKTLESFCDLFGNGGDYSVLSKCPKLKAINLYNCGGKINIKKLTKLPLECFYCNGTEILNVNTLSKLKKLTAISITLGSDSASSVKTALEKALPKCEITVRGN